MWSEAGQIAHLAFGGVRKSGGGDPGIFQSRPLTVTDPVSGKQFTQETNPHLISAGIRAPGITSDNAQTDLSNFQAQAKAAADTKAAADKAAADTAAATAESTFQTNKTNATNAARTGAVNFIQQQGLDPARFSSQLDDALTRTAGGIKDLDPNPTGAFDPNLGQSIINNFTTAGRTRATASVNDLFSPTYSADRLQTSAIDPLVNDILNEQFNPVNTSLSFARDRGQLSPSGFAAAQDLLNSKRTAAESTVRGLGSAALTKDRTDIDSLITGAKNTAGGLTASQFDTFNPATFRSQADDLVNRDLSSLGGDIRNSVGQSKFVDLSELLAAGGSAQGPSQVPAGPGVPLGAFGGDASDPTAALADKAKRDAAQRGLGSQGAF